MKTKHTIRTGIIMLLFLAFGYARAGFIPVISTTPACNNNGTATITGTGVPGPFSFYIYGQGIYQGDSNEVSSATFTGLPAGTYTFGAYSPSGGQLQGTLTIAAALDVQVSITNATCPGNSTGTGTATVISGTAPYTYAWSSGATTQTASNLAIGISTLTVSDNAGCVNILYDTVEMISPVQCLVTHTGPVCSGTLLAAGSGGTGPYSYMWSNGATTPSITFLTSGYYYYATATDANGCQGTGYSYTTNTGLAFDTIHTAITEPSCGSNGSISVVMASGTAPYTYTWSNGSTSSSVTGLISNQYNVTVTDANGCTGQYQYYLYGNTLYQYPYTYNPSCGTSTGGIVVSVYGGASPYTYAWAGNNVNHTNVDSNLTAGTYFYSVTDANGCTLTDSVTLIPQGNFNATISVSNIVCPATTGGSMTVNVTGNGPYTYLWNNGATTQTLTNLSEGQGFWVTVSDGNGCQTLAWSDSVSITSPFSVSFNTVACANTATGVVTGGTPPYTYLWSNGATTSAITYQLYSSYSLQVTDASGCSNSQYLYINTSGISIDSSNNITYPTCSSTGSIIATPLNGVAPFTYIWSNGATTATISGLTFGSYDVTVTDANGCTGQAYYYLGQNNMNVYPNNTTTSCGASNGSIILYTYGGTAPYYYTWSNTSTNHTDRDTLIPSGNYTYTVTDASGCSVTGTDELTAHGSYNVNVTPIPTSCNQANPTGGVTVTTVNGGTPPFTFNWQVWDGQSYSYPVTNGGLSGLAYGTDVWLNSVTDANGCTDSSINYVATDTFGLSINYDPSCYDDITGYVYYDANGNCIKDNGEAGIPGTIAQASGTNNQYYYAVTDSNGFYDIQVLPGTYTVTTYNNYGSCNPILCTSSYTQTLTGTGALSSGNNFGYTNATSYNLAVHPGYSPSYPGSSKEYWVYYYNYGNNAVNNTVITFVHDPNLTLTSTNPPCSSYNPSTQTITWNVGTVGVSYFNSQQVVTMNFDVPSTLPLNTILTCTSLITPVTNDCNPVDNSESLSDIVTGSHDPNEKEVSPAGNITASDSVLNYTIRFQNTGTAPAYKIVVVDTLSPLVNPATLVFGASSSPYTYKITGNGIITFTFDPIYLPDSSHGRDSSSGFVMYSVHTRPTDIIGQQVKNTAYIYFDFNPAVVTNTTISTLSLTSGIRNISAGAMSVNVSPNPVHDKSQFSIEGATGEVLFSIDDVTGQRIFEKNTSDSNIIFDSNAFAAGIYIYTARDAKNNTCTGKIVIAH